MPDEVADVGDVLGKKGGGVNVYKDVPSGDCNCYMQILSISGHDGFWRFRDVSAPMGGYDFDIWGLGQSWLSGGGFIPLPSDFLPLDPPDAGCHHFEFLVNQGVDGQLVTLYTTVICCEGEGPCNEDNAATQTYPQFLMVVNNDDAGLSKADYYRKFDCVVLPDGEGNCDPRF